MTREVGRLTLQDYDDGDLELLTLDAANSALLVIDIQDRLAGAMKPDDRALVEKNTAILIAAAARFDMPVVVSQQYPKGLGETTETIKTALADLGGAERVFDKVAFSACQADGFEDAAEGADGRTWIVTGMECHVCVYQTVRDLIARGDNVHVPQDAVSSRTGANWAVGLDLMRASGACITSTEAVVFDWLKQAGSDDFKALSRLVR